MKIAAKEIQKAIDPKARWIAKDENGTVSWFDDKPRICGKEWGIIGFNGLLGKIEVSEFEGKDWTECCLELDPDYSKWCGCLCYFWDDEGDNFIIGILEGVYENQRDNGSFKYQNGRLFRHCRPVRRDEVEFVEDGE